MLCRVRSRPPGRLPRAQPPLAPEQRAHLAAAGLHAHTVFAPHHLGGGSSWVIHIAVVLAGSSSACKEGRAPGSARR